MQQQPEEVVADVTQPEGNNSTASPTLIDPADTLREILFSEQHQQIITLEAKVAELESQLSDPQRLASLIAPSLGDAIRRQIQDNRAEVIEALYPIIGQTVLRAVSEAMRDLARTIDAQRRSYLNPQAFIRRFASQISGVSGADVSLREALPFKVAELFLIHRDSGLLLWYQSSDATHSPDSDIISGMLTAIRDFVQESFGRGEAGNLDEIQYGGRRILLETAKYVYLAVVVDGIEPPGFRAEMRKYLIDINHRYRDVLQDYDGDATRFTTVETTLSSLLPTSANEVSDTDKASHDVEASPPSLQQWGAIDTAGLIVIIAVILLIIFLL
ncbi:MAG: hypothetical protein AAF485_31780 [Chloroflexota bacterium]